MSLRNSWKTNHQIHSKSEKLAGSANQPAQQAESAHLNRSLKYGMCMERLKIPLRLDEFRVGGTHAIHELDRLERFMIEMVAQVNALIQ